MRLREVEWNCGVSVEVLYRRWRRSVAKRRNLLLHGVSVVFLFQAEDGIRDYKVTGVQTCALPIFIRYLAVERGLSDNYQLSTERSLTDFARWCAGTRRIESFKAVNLATISEYLADKKRAALSAASIKLIVVALKIFFRFLSSKGEVER